MFYLQRIICKCFFRVCFGRAMEPEYIVCMSPKQLCVIERNPTQFGGLNLDRLNSRSDAEQTYGRESRKAGALTEAVVLLN